MLDHKINIISYLSQYKEEMPAWLKNYTDGSKVDFCDIMSSRIGYYPGSEYDGSLIEIGNRSHTIHSFLYVDYLLAKGDLIEHLEKPNSIHGYHRIGRIEWQEKDLIPNGPHSMHLNRLQGRNPMAFEPERPYCFTEILERDDNRGDYWGSERFAITFLCADGIASYLQLFCGEYKKAPWLVLLQDHGFGCNYDKFGKGGILDEIIEKTGVKSPYVLCADNTHIWDGYTKIEDIPPVSGGMHRHLRFLYRLSNHPEALNDVRLEDAFKSPIYDEQGYAPCLPTIIDSNICHNLSDDVKAISYLSATLTSELYSKYLDEEAIVWDNATQELLLYIPDKRHPAVAFRGSRWLYAYKLKKEYWDPDTPMRIQIKRMYSLIKYRIKNELILKSE